MSTNHPLRLAVGSHKAGSGKGCAMNVVSWENGDTKITDLPACADPLLARIVQRVNDTLCTHRDGDLLCPSCSLLVLDLAHRTVGTALVDLSELEVQRVWVRVAADQARQVLHLNDDPRVLAAIVAAEAWANHPTASIAADAYAATYAANAAHAANAASIAATYAATYAANAAAHAAHAARFATNATYAAYAAVKAVNAVNDAAYAVNADTVANAVLQLAHRAVDTFEAVTGRTATQAERSTTATAIRNMLAVPV